MTWDADTERFSGDVRLQGRREPVGLRGAEDVYVSADAVDGTLTITDAEYVFTDLPADAEPVDPDAVVDTEVTGDLEDGYVDGVADDAVVAEAEDVFVEHGAADALAVRGVEQVFRDDAAAPTRSPDGYEVSVTGWKHSRSARDPRDGVSVTGAKNEVTVTEAEHDLTVYVTGWENEVRIEGRGVEVTVYFVGRDNRVTASHGVSVTTGAESGFENTAESDPVPPELLVDTSKSEARAFLGRHRVTWQEPASDKDWCPNCGESADAIIERHQKDAFYLFGLPVRTYESGDVSYECEACSPHAVGDVALTEAERKSALR